MEPTLGINSMACDVSEPGCLVCASLSLLGEEPSRYAEEIPWLLCYQVNIGESAAER